MNNKKVVQLVQETDDDDDSYRRAPEDPIPEVSVNAVTDANTLEA